MKNIFCRIISLFLLLSFASCSTMPYTAATPKVNFPQFQLLKAGSTQRPAPQQPFQMQLTQMQNQSSSSASSSSLYWTGDGGSGKSIFIATPRGADLKNDLLEQVAVDLSNTFLKYSAITPFDRVTQMGLYKELESGLLDDRASQDFGSLSTDYVLQGNITRTSAGYTLQLTVNRTSDKAPVASYSGTVSLADLEKLTGVRRASLDLLQKMGVQLTARARNELTGEATSDQVNAVIAMAQGINAQRQGTVDALTYYYMAENYDPSLADAVRGTTVLSANISTGNIGANVRNDFAWNSDWKAKLTETETLMNNILQNTTPQRSIWYSTNIVEQESARDYNRRTTELRIEAVLHTHAALPVSVQKTVQAVYDGLQSTGRAQAWSLTGWPWQGVSNTNPFSKTWGSMISIAFEVLNDQKQVIGRQTVEMDGRYSFYGTSLSGPGTAFTTVRFTGVSGDAITDSMSIRIASINGRPPEQAGISRIEPLSSSQIQANRNLTIYNGTLQPSSNNRDVGSVRIQAELWGERISSMEFENCGVTLVYIYEGITHIGDRAFADNQLTSITIPEGVTSIGASAFANNKLSHVTIAESVTSIGESAFANNKLKYIDIPEGVTSIGESAFANNQLTEVTIPEGVNTIGNKAFADNHWASTGNRSDGSSYTFHHGLTSVTIPSSITSIGKDAFTFSWEGRWYTQVNEVRIGSNVRFSNEAVGNGFEAFYAGTGRKEGIYRYDKRWERFEDESNLSQTLAVRQKRADIGGIIAGLLVIALAVGGVYMIWFYDWE